MKRQVLIALTCISASIGVRSIAAGAGEISGFKVPPGFVIERAAPEGSLRFPMFAAFDDRGRLFVAESSGLDLYAELAAGTRKCRVSVLEDRDGDGRFESVARLRRQARLSHGPGLARRAALRRRPARPRHARGHRRRRPRRPAHGDPHRLRPPRQRQPARADLRARRPALHDDGHARRLPAQGRGRAAGSRARAGPSSGAGPTARGPRSSAGGSSTWSRPCSCRVATSSGPTTGTRSPPAASAMRSCTWSRAGSIRTSATRGRRSRSPAIRCRRCRGSRPWP